MQCLETLRIAEAAQPRVMRTEEEVAAHTHTNTWMGEAEREGEGEEGRGQERSVTADRRPGRGHGELTLA